MTESFTKPSVNNDDSAIEKQEILTDTPWDTSPSKHIEYRKMGWKEEQADVTGLMKELVSRIALDQDTNETLAKLGIWNTERMAIKLRADFMETRDKEQSEEHNSAVETY